MIRLDARCAGPRPPEASACAGTFGGLHDDEQVVVLVEDGGAATWAFGLTRLCQLAGGAARAARRPPRVTGRQTSSAVGDGRRDAGSTVMSQQVAQHARAAEPVV